MSSLGPDLRLPAESRGPRRVSCESRLAFIGREWRAPVTQAQIDALQKAVQNAQSAGDNAWMLVSAALVLLMTGPGLALFYGGLVRKKNILGTMMQASR